MPYIKRETREDIDNALYEVSAFLQQLEDSDRDGALNYAISMLVAIVMKPKSGRWRYHSAVRAYAVFMAAGAEFYRRVLAPYEDRAIRTNGDIDPYIGSDQD